MEFSRKSIIRHVTSKLYNGRGVLRLCGERPRHPVAGLLVLAGRLSHGVAGFLLALAVLPVLVLTYNIINNKSIIRHV
jgi:hypothetical protein